MKRLILLLLLFSLLFCLSACNDTRIMADDYDRMYDYYSVVRDYLDDPDFSFYTYDEASEALDKFWKEVDRIYY